MGKRPDSAAAWEALPLVKQLTDRDYAASVHLVFKFLEPLTGRTRPPGAEALTDHDIVHSARIVFRIGQILRPDNLLNQSEIYLLLLSALLHDAGMWVPRAEANAILADPEFLKWAEAEMPIQLENARTALRNGKRHWLGQLGLQQLAALWARKSHPERLGTHVLSEASPTGKTLRELISREFLDSTVDICVAHSWERRVVVEHDDLRTREIGHSGDLVRVRLLAALLRLGDLLDLGEGRISTLLWDYLRPLPPLSEAHWRKEHTLRVEVCQPDLIVLQGKFEAGGAMSLEERHTVAEAYRLALDWIGYLKAEIAECAHVVEARIVRETQGSRLFGSLILDSSRVVAPHLAVDGPISFQFNRRRIIELLGDEVYSVGSVFVRELLQNATDATRAAMLRRHSALSKQDPQRYPADHPWEWPSSITSSPNWVIEVETSNVIFHGQEFLEFVVRDNGIGMTLDQVRNHFLQIGASYYQTSQFVKEFSFPPISCFGIGFLSCLAIADRVEVHTRAANEPYGLRLSLQLPSDHYVIEKDVALPEGTTVKLWIDRNAKHPPGWDQPPMNAETRRVLIERARQLGGLEDAIHEWPLFIEFPIRINGTLWPARPPRWSQDYFLSNYLDLPLKVADSNGRIVATGRLLILAHRSGLPTKSGFDPKIIPILLVNRGFWVDGNGAFGAAIILLNAYHLPPRFLTAPRSVRSDLMPLRELREIVIDRVFRHATQVTSHQSAALSAIWNAGVHEDILGKNVKFPVRTSETLDWLTLTETMERHGRIIIVPVHIAVRGPWVLDVPAFGWPKNGSTIGWPGGYDPLNGVAIRVDGLCTGILFPPTARYEDLPQVATPASYTPLGFRVWRDMTLPHKLSDSLWEYDSRRDRYELPDYDKSGDPWLLDEEYVKEGSGANSGLPDYALVTYPDDLLNIVIRDATEWA